MSKPTSVTGSESEFEFIETPKPTAPTFEKDEDCGVRTTKVCFVLAALRVLGEAPTPIFMHAKRERDVDCLLLVLLLHSVLSTPVYILLKLLQLSCFRDHEPVS